MMTVRKSFTAVIERNAVFKTNFWTEPYEAGWSGEARWFVRVMEMNPLRERLSIYPQISPDGLFWCDEGSEPLLIEAPGLYSFSLREYGQWLRLRGDLQGTEPLIKAMIYLSLKE
jgi:hypothetical protein